MLFILDYQQNTIGVANNGSPFALPYYNDIHTESLDGVNTYEFTVPSDHPDASLFQVEGHVIITNLDGEQILFTIKQIQDTNDSGKKVKNIFCEETAITELLSDVQRPVKWESVTLEYAVNQITSGYVDWKLSKVPNLGSYDVEFQDYMTVLEALRQVVSQFGAEMYFTVKLQGTKIVEKQINIVEQRGTNTGVRFDYSYDLKGVSRTEDSSQVVTALIGVGKGDDQSVRVNLTSQPAFVDGDFYKNAGADWIGSYSALNQWGINGKHRFGVYVIEDADTPQELQRRTLRELADRIKPTVQYSASIANFERITGYEAKKVRLGDSVVVNDKTFSSPIVIDARINQTKRSYTRTDADEVDLGNYKPRTLSPMKDIKDLQNIISRSQEQWNASGITVHIEALGGNTFKNGSGSTTLNPKVFSGKKEVDLNGTEYTYRWFKYDSAGTLINLWGGTTDYRTGKSLQVTSLDVTNSATFLVQVIDSTNTLVGQSQLTVFEVNDGEKGDKGDKGDQGIQGIQGVRGADGTTYYTWIKYADSPTSGMSDLPDGKAYMGIAYNKTTPTESTNYSDYQWVKVKGEQGIQGLQGIQGEKGDQGIQGVAGRDGVSSYTHIAYADSADGRTNFSTSDSNRLYIGMYVDTVATDSTDPTKYKWTLVKGQKGDQGIQGQAGADGKTPYLHIAYASSADGATNFSVSDPTGRTYIGTYTDFNVSDSTNPSTYSWSLIKGDKGDKGNDGLNAIMGVLSNDAHTLQANSSGTVSSFTGAVSTLTIFNGTADDTANWTITATPSSGVTGSLSGNTYTVSGLSVDSGYVDFTATRSGYPTISKRFTLSKAKAGTNGSSATTYWLVNSVSAIKKDTSGAYTPSTITVSGKSQSGTATPVNYSGRFIISESTDGSTFTAKYTSSANESSKTYTPNAGIVALKVQMYLAGGTTTLLDEQIIPVVADGLQGVAGAKGADGQTTYTWIKYADTETGSGLSDSPDGKRYLGIAYNKTTATESTNPSDYSWSPLYDNVVVGGVNIVPNSDFSDNTDPLTGYAEYQSANTEWEMIDGVGLKVSKVSTVAVGSPVGVLTPLMSVIAGATYTISFDAIVPTGITPNVNYSYLMYYVTGVSNSVYSSKMTGLDAPYKNDGTYDYYRVVATITATTSSDGARLLIGFKTVGDSTVTEYVIVNKIQVENGNVATDWTPSLMDTDKRINDIALATSSSNIVNTVIYDDSFTSILSDYAKAEDISDMATGTQLTEQVEAVTKYIDGRLDDKGGINEKINAVSSELTKTANAINAKFSSSGGINLIKNSIGYAGSDFWGLYNGLEAVQNPDLEQLGFGAGWHGKSKNGTGSAYADQWVTVQPNTTYTLSFWLKKLTDNASNGWANVEVYDINNVALIKVGKGSGGGTTNGKWELGIGQFSTPYTQVKIHITVGYNVEAYFSGLMLNVGQDALQWQHANGEVYNTNVQMNLNGIKVINENTKGFTVMSPQEFSGYAEVTDDNGTTSVQRVFTLNGSTTEVTELDVDNQVTMQKVSLKWLDTGTNKGWGFIGID